MPKKDPVLVALFKCPEKLNAYLLRTYGLPQEPSSRNEVQQDCLPRDERGRRLTLDELGESVTQQTDELTSLHHEAGADESIALSPQWLRYLEYMDVIAAALSPKDRGAELKKLFLADARSRYWEHPPEVRVPESLTPAELWRKWAEHEIDIRPVGSNRRDQIVEIIHYPMPPDEPEDLDPADAPPGHWEGLRWVPAETPGN
jgi:hypothetical protein